ncbi:MAG: S16 family serine protease, partial [Acidobacteriota bacterium]
IATSIISLLTEIPVNRKVAMTGEITLRGKVLPVGGIKEKLLAAHREGIREALIPLDNKADLKDLPKVIKQEVKLHLVENMDEVLKIALTAPLPQKPAKGKAVMPAELSQRGGEGEGPTEPPLTH